MTGLVFLTYVSGIAGSSMRDPSGFLKEDSLLLFVRAMVSAGVVTVLFS